MTKVLTIDPSGTGTNGICWITNGMVTVEEPEFKSKEWKEHLNYLIIFDKD